MSIQDDFGQLRRRLGVEAPDVDGAELERLWRLTGIADPVLFDDFVDTVARTAGAEWAGIPIGDDELGLRLGQWRIDVTKGTAGLGILTPLLAAVLIPRGLGEFTVGFVTAALPAVLDIERVRLSAGDHRLLWELRMKHDIRNRYTSADEIYAALPETTRNEINHYDFADFLERLHEGGFADERDDGLIWIWPT